MSPIFIAVALLCLFEAPTAVVSEITAIDAWSSKIFDTAYPGQRTIQRNRNNWLPSLAWKGNGKVRADRDSNLGFFKSHRQPYPWLLIKLSKIATFSGIRVTHCQTDPDCGSTFKKIQVRVGMKWDEKSNPVVGYFDGPVPFENRKEPPIRKFTEIKFDKPATGRYLSLMVDDNAWSQMLIVNGLELIDAKEEPTPKQERPAGTGCSGGICAPSIEAPYGVMHKRCTRTAHIYTFDGEWFDAPTHGDFETIKSDRNNFAIHTRNAHCIRRATGCNCAIAIREGDTVLRLNVCGVTANLASKAEVSFLSKKEPPRGWSVEEEPGEFPKYFITLPSSTKMEIRMIKSKFGGPDAWHQWLDLHLDIAPCYYNHADGQCGSWDRKMENDRDPLDFKLDKLNSLFFYEPQEGETKCQTKKDIAAEQATLPAGASCPFKHKLSNPDFNNLVFPDAAVCEKQRDEEPDPADEVLPEVIVNPNEGLEENPETPVPVGKWPTPLGKTKKEATEHCTKNLKKSDTYKKCKKVLGNRFKIDDAVAECVLDVRDTDEYKEDAGRELMKKQCLDVANDEEDKKIEGESCPNDCSDNGTCENGKCKCNDGFVGADCSRKLDYELYKGLVQNKACNTGKRKVKGCYRTHVKDASSATGERRGKLLVTWRNHIEWGNIDVFAKALACACADAARAAGAKHFGLHYWGECWALDMKKDLKKAPNGDCLLADGNYKTKCSKMNKRYDHVCLGAEDYYTYNLIE